jgi:predicted nucleic acid-binding protein
MKYVLDASVALKWVLSEPDSPAAIKLRDEFTRQIHDFIAPDTFLAEVAHALTKAERRGLIGAGQASMLVADVLTSRPDLHSFIPLLARAIDLATQARIGVYDCLYVGLAEREQCPLLTADQRLANTFQGQFPVVLLGAVP